MPPKPISKPNACSRSHLICLIICLVTFSALAGCQAQRYRAKGDAALLQGDVHHAARLYQLALSSDANLAEDPKFAASFNEAQWRSALHDARRFTDQRYWSKAISSYERVLELSPGHPTAQTERASVLKQAAASHYDAAIAAANKGNQSAAVESLQQVILFQPDHSNASTALTSIQNETVAKQHSQFQTANAAIQQRALQAAANTLQVIVTTDPTFFPARLALHQTNSALITSGTLSTKAATHLSKHHLDAAVVDAQRAINIWANNADAKSIKANADAQRIAALALLKDTKASRDQAQWDQAINQARQFISQYADHPESRTLVSTLKTQAAAYHLGAGKEAAKNKRDDLAEAHFRKALTLQPNDTAAKTQLAAVFTRRGQGAENDKLPGNAYLWYADAQALAPTAQSKTAVSRVRTAVFQSSMVNVKLVVSKPDNANAQSSTDAAAIKGDMLQRALKSSPPAFQLTNDAFQPADKNVKRIESNYIAAFTATPVDIKRVVVSRVNRDHVYSVSRQVPNPKIARLEHELRHAEDGLRHARRHIIRQHCHVCGGSGHIKHSSHSSHSTKSSNSSKGSKGKHGSHDKHDRGRSHSSSVRCSHCSGSGYIRAYDRHAVHHAQSKVNHARNALARAPRFLIERETRRWPYTVETIRVTGQLNLAVNVTDAKTQKAIATFNISPKFNQKDTHIIDANPSIGLPEDALNLPSNAQVRQFLIADAGKQAMRRITDTTIINQANLAITRANDYASKKQSDLDIEHRVRAALLLQTVRPDESAKLLKSIRGN